MTLFDPQQHLKSDAHQKLYTQAEIAYTVVDFIAAVMFIIGSILFFFESTTFLATWLFLIGSICFGLRPTIKLIREIGYLRLNK